MTSEKVYQYWEEQFVKFQLKSVSILTNLKGGHFTFIHNNVDVAKALNSLVNEFKELIKRRNAVNEVIGKTNKIAETKEILGEFLFEIGNEADFNSNFKKARLELIYQIKNTFESLDIKMSNKSYQEYLCQRLSNNYNIISINRALNDLSEFCGYKRQYFIKSKFLKNTLDWNKDCFASSTRTLKFLLSEGYFAKISIKSFKEILFRDTDKRIVFLKDLSSFQRIVYLMKEFEWFNDGKNFWDHFNSRVIDIDFKPLDFNPSARAKIMKNEIIKNMKPHFNVIQSR